MSNVQRVFYVGVSPTPIDPQTGRSSHWVKFTGGAGIAPQFPVNANFTVTEAGHPDQGVTYAVTINAMYGVDGQLFAVGGAFLTEGYARIDAPRETELGTGTLDIFDATASANTSYVDAITNSAPEFYWQFNETSGTTAVATLGASADLTYDSDASTYNTTTSLADGTGFAKNANIQTNRAIYDSPPVPSGATVFSVDLFTGNNSARTVVNGLDMATNGGALITYNRDNGRDGFMDSARGVGNPDTLLLFSASTSQQTLNINGITSFNSDGWTLPPNIYTNTNLADFSTYSFMRDSRFFDCLTYAGNGVSGRSIAHSLDVAPGMIFIKAYDYDIGVPIVWHKDLAGSNDGVPLWTAEDPITTNDYWANTAPTDSVFTVGNRRDVNDASYNFIAWIFAHDPANFSYCGSYTGNGSTQSINLGWQPQFLLVKNITPSNTQRWLFFDDQRGATTGNDFVGQNVQNAEITGVDYIDFTSTGFDINTSVAGMNASSNSYIFYAVRV